MLKVIIADDERIQREGVLNNISWNHLAMEVAGVAKDGIEALELVRQHNPDVIITDVKMPRMDGLELSQKVRELYPDTKILIISGYDEFEYARAAIEFNAYAYMLKPIDVEEMQEELQKISRICEKETSSREEVQRMRSQLEESKPLLVDKFIKDLLYGILEDGDTIRNRSEYLSVMLPQGGFYLLLIQIDESFESGVSEENKYFFYLNFANHLKSLCEMHWNNLLVQVKEAEFVLVLFEDDEARQDITDTLVCIRDGLLKKFPQDVTIGISNLKNGISHLHESYKEAEAATRQKFYLGKGKNIFYGDIDRQVGMPVSVEDEYEKLIINLEIGNANLAEETVDKIFDLLTKGYTSGEHHVKAFCYRIIGDVYRVLYAMNEKVANIFGEEYILWKKVSCFETIPDVRQWLKNIIACIARHIYNKQSNKNLSVVEVIIQTIENRYSEHITIEELAKLVYLTPNYICNIFKENTGESIIDYLTKVRMRHARKFLADSSLKIYEVAEKSGFVNTSYFGQVFKNFNGVTPKEYRDKILSGENNEKNS